MDYSQNKDDWMSILTGEMLLFGLLGKIIYIEPDKHMMQQLIDEDVFSEVPLENDEEETKIGLALLSHWTAVNKNGLDKETLNALNTDYLYLFIGPGIMYAPLWESVYFNDKHLLFQEQTMDVRRWYRRFGLEIENIHQVPDDHIGLEMSFIAHLASLALKSLTEQNPTRFDQLMTAQKEFISEHLNQWGFDWAKLVVEHARTDFYRGLGYLTTGSLKAINNILEIDVLSRAHV